MEHVGQTDSKIDALIGEEYQRQAYEINLIASENIASQAVLEVQGSVLTNKYAEGYPSRRYYGGCKYVDKIEAAAIDRAKELFGARYANVQPHSGSSANMAVYFALLNPNDTVLAMDLSNGGHLTHGAPVSFSGRFFNFVHYGLSKETGRIDMDQVETLAKKHRPKMIVAGASAYPRIIDFNAFSAIAKSIGASLMVDMAHIAGLVAAGIHPTPVGYADIITSTTHKTLRGPRGGLIIGDEKLGKSVDSQIFPGIQGGPLMHVIAAKAVAFKEAFSPDFKAYQQQVVKNTAILADIMMDRGYKLVSDGTDNHMVLVDFSDKELTGKEAEERLGKAGIIVNKNTVPDEKRGPFVTSGIRIGLPLMTTRQVKEEAAGTIAGLICDVLDDAANIENTGRQVKDLCRQYPMYT